MKLVNARTAIVFGSLAAILVAAVFMGYWLTLPPERFALDDSCAPADVASQLSAKLYGREFWEKQRTALTDEIRTMQDLQNAAKEGSGRSLIISPVEQRMRRLSDKEAADLAAGDEAAWRDQMLMLGRCATVVASHLAR